jgi:hypothetical protein
MISNKTKQIIWALKAGGDPLVHDEENLVGGVDLSKNEIKEYVAGELDEYCGIDELRELSLILKHDYIDDGRSHDISSASKYRINSKIDDVWIYVYENNAETHIDIKTDDITLKEWFDLWDEYPEEWIKKELEKDNPPT